MDDAVLHNVSGAFTVFYGTSTFGTFLAMGLSVIGHFLAHSHTPILKSMQPGYCYFFLLALNDLYSIF